jgi:hypothetical protein
MGGFNGGFEARGNVDGHGDSVTRGGDGISRYAECANHTENHGKWSHFRGFLSYG